MNYKEYGCGEKETRGIKRSAQMISRAIPSSLLTELPAVYHGEFSINHSHDYVAALKDITKA